MGQPALGNGALDPEASEPMPGTRLWRGAADRPRG
jgi:hypothetical protein